MKALALKALTCGAAALGGVGPARAPTPRSSSAWLLVLVLLPLMASAQELFHRAEQDREIRYWLLEPATHQFRISHDFTVTRPGQKSVHSFVRKGSVVSPDAKMTDLDSGKPLVTHAVAGKDVNALGYYPNKVDDDSVAVQGELDHPIGEGQSTRIRVEETYTDPVGYTVEGGEKPTPAEAGATSIPAEQLVWKRTLGRPLNYVTLPPGWMLTSVNTPAVITLDEQGRVTLRLANPRNDELSVVIKGRRRATPRDSASVASVAPPPSAASGRRGRRPHTQ